MEYRIEESVDVILDFLIQPPVLPDRGLFKRREAQVFGEMSQGAFAGTGSRA